MSKEQALSIISELAYKAELPKGLTGNEAKMYIDQLNMAINILESCIKDN
tara:strand:- start:1900 stop:2049 length:150 start_codon:yes stop_codon:yes gene_type:complete